MTSKIPSYEKVLREEGFVRTFNTPNFKSYIRLGHDNCACNVILTYDSNTNVSSKTLTPIGYSEACDDIHKELNEIDYQMDTEK